MKQHLKIAAFALVAVAAIAAGAISSCSSDKGSGPNDTTQATIDNTTVANGIAVLSPLVPVCNPGGSPSAAASIDMVSQRTKMLLDARIQRALDASLNSASLTGTRPADQLGECGGRMTYADYSHSNGVTTGTLAFENYCSVDSETGVRTLMDGRIPFVNTGTPSASGPITSKIEADSPNGVELVTRTSTGTQLTSERFTFENYLYTAGVPGGSPTASNPSRLATDEFVIIDQVTNKSYRTTGLTLTTFEPPSGGSQVTITGRGRRENGDYFDITTSTPWVTNNQGNTVSGEFVFTGANGSNAHATLVPGSTLQASVTVNGVPYTNVPPCR